MQQKGTKSRLFIINYIIRFIKFLGNTRDKINEKMADKYSPEVIALCASAICVVILILMLFVPPYLGVADDGSLEKIMNSASIFYPESNINDFNNDYFVREYSTISSKIGSQSFKAGHVVFVKIAKMLDYFFTHDNLFDIRFLSLIYGSLFIPAFYIMIKQFAKRVEYLSEGILIGVLGVLIFTDLSYTTYFNSFYPEAVWYISLMYCVGIALSFQRDKYRTVKLLGLAICGAILTLSRKQCAIIGIFLAAFFLKRLYYDELIRRKILCGFLAVVLVIAGFISYFNLDDDFIEISKYHAMTRGVLFQSENPEETLIEFGIDSRYSILADISAYDNYPLVKVNNSLIQKEFYDKYTTLDISLYYLKHPVAFLRMMDAATKASFEIKRNYCGNYEESTGKPPNAKSIFWSFWSIFKERSAPKTIGYFIVLIIACFILLGQRRGLDTKKDKSKEAIFDTSILVICISISQAVITIVKSGDAQLIQHIFLMGMGIDMLTFVVFVELLHRLNIIETERKKKFERA